VGGTRPVQVDVRVIAASNKDLAEEVREGRFREDLYYRLNVFPVEIPPLRKRPEDIPLLVDYFIERFSSEMGKQVAGIDDNALNMLVEYEWKGNVRELENTIERAMILADGDRIRKEHIVLVPVSTEASTSAEEVEGSLEDVAREAQRTAETRLIKKVLEETRWNKTRAAEILKVSYKTLLNKIKEYGLE
ncbi:MAG: sigma-54-dependent Fis family transcriptional regulator, partial [Nitrospirae bacterium]